MGVLEQNRLRLQAQQPSPESAGLVPAQLPSAQQGTLLRNGRGQPSGAVGSSLTGDRLRRLAAADSIAVAVVTCKRPKYLQRAMDSFMKARGDQVDKFPFIISQDAYDPEMIQLIDTQYVAQGIAFHMNHQHDPNANQIAKQFGGNKQ